MIDRWELENGSVKSQISQIYALTKADIQADPTIVEVLRRNLKSSNEELLEMSIMRLGVRAKDVFSVEPIMALLSTEQRYLPRAAAISALGSIARHLLEQDEPMAREIARKIRSLPLSAEECRQVKEEFCDAYQSIANDL